MFQEPETANDFNTAAWSLSLYRQSSPASTEVSCIFNGRQFGAQTSGPYNTYSLPAGSL